jgi:hypothetical protein
MRPIKPLLLGFTVVVAIFLGVARFADAAPPAPGARADSALRITADAHFFGGTGVGLDYSRRLGRWGGIDLTLSDADLGHNHAGLGVGAMGQLLIGDDWGNSFVMAAGPSFVEAPQFGGVAFLTTEIGYDLRRRGLPSLLLAVGPEWALSDSGKATCPDGGFLGCLFWKDQYHAGDVGFHARIAIGFAF